MKLDAILKRYHFTPEITDILLAKGIQTLHPPQEEAIKAGVLDGSNVVMSVPTAAGKTLIAELCMLKAIQEKRGTCLYVAPLKALASEKYQEFKKSYKAAGIKVGIATGDLDSPDKNLGGYDIVIATAEKIDSLLRNSARWLSNLSVMVLDEIHFINDFSRGPTMEIVTARLKQLNSNIQILGLSATISNAEEMSQWLDGNLAFSTWRPIPLNEGVYFDDKIQFNDGNARMITETSPDEVAKLCLDTIKGGGQAIVFVNSRRSAQACARNISKYIAPTLNAEEQVRCGEASKKVAPRATATKICKTLAGIIGNGVAFHHAGLKPNQRETIENGFKSNFIKVICATPTLAAGVNLPARRVIMRDMKRFASGMGSVYIPSSEYKQCAGRAGRPQYDSVGEAIIMAKSLNESDTLFDKFIEADTEPVTSKLDNEASMRKHILASIAAGYVHDANGMFEFLNHTFLVHQQRGINLVETVGNIFDFLHEKGFIEKTGFRYFATPLGNRTSRLYIDPISALTIKEGLRKVHEGRPFSSIGLLHLMCCCPDSDMLNLSKKDYGNLEDFHAKVQDELIVDDDEMAMLDDYYSFYAILKTVWMLTRWIDEDKEENICELFNIGPGDVYRHVEATQWLLYGASAIAELMRYGKLAFVTDNLRKRVRYGIKEELLPLASLKGIGRIRARQLFKSGFHKPADFQFSTIDQIAAIPGIGMSVAKTLVTPDQTPPYSSR